ncbi:MAG: DUF4267 domain-containing protein [Stackebrandtia sp.]
MRNANPALGWPARIGLAGATLTAAALTAIAISWLVDPAGTSLIFGVELSGQQLAYGRVKGAEDLLAATAIGLFLVRRDRSALIGVLAVGLLVPVGDIAAVVLAGAGALDNLAVHACFLAVMASSIALLRFDRPSDRAGTRRRFDAAAYN